MPPRAAVGTDREFSPERLGRLELELGTIAGLRLGKPWLQIFEDMLVAAVGAESGSRVLDVGCGTGSTTLAVARRLGAKGRCTTVRAFANLRRAAANDARLRSIAWIEARS